NPNRNPADPGILSENIGGRRRPGLGEGSSRCCSRHPFASHRSRRWVFSWCRRYFCSLHYLDCLSGVHTPTMIGKARPGVLIPTSCLCPVRRHSVRLRPATPVVSNAGHVHILSWCTAYGRNTNAGFPHSVWFPRRGSIAISCGACWI